MTMRTVCSLLTVASLLSPAMAEDQPPPPKLGEWAVGGGPWACKSPDDLSKLYRLIVVDFAAAETMLDDGRCRTPRQNRGDD